ncbi:MAG TPA: hypothetical protein IGS37_00080 [Synechococcales cyanobacterium M55_K2018_004]|nr:hypothetical protein [Synechococcales cyanobacterium M55_K2018_004]
MTSIQTPGSLPRMLLASRVLKIAGIIIILAALVDMMILPYPYDLGNRQWQIGFVAQFVDRGLVPLVGLALVLTAYWIDTLPKGSSVLAVYTEAEGRPLWADLRLWLLLLASLLGLLYLLMFPLHLSNISSGNTELQQRIEQEATQAEQQLNQQLQGRVEQLRSQINQLVNATDEQINQAVQARIITEEQANRIREFKRNPASIDPYLQQQADQLRGQLQTEIGDRRAQAQARARQEALKSGLRVSINSLLLAVGYSLIGWFGLRSLLRQE